MLETKTPLSPNDGAQVGSSGAASAYTHQQIVRVLTGLMCCMFVTMASSTIVNNALPRIMSDLHGSETSYTWVVTILLLAQTSSTPIWGKLADQFNRKFLLQLSVVIFVVGSVIAGLAQSVPLLLAARALQGIGAGGVQAMSQTVIAAIVSARDRGRYSAYLGSVFASATLAGPLLGGVLVSTPVIAWRACFFVGLPIAAVALTVIHRTLHLPTVRRPVEIDYLGSALVVGGVSTLLAWISLAGSGTFEWKSTQSAVLLPLSIVLLGVALRVESRAAEPIIPLNLLRHRTIALAAGAGVIIGISIFASTLFLNQFFQLAKGFGPTTSGLLSMPLVLGMVISGIVAGRIVSRSGKWRKVVIIGMCVCSVGTALLGTANADTPSILIMLYCGIAGVGFGAVTQNLLVAVQNAAPLRELGTATASVSFFRTLGGAAGVSTLGAVLASHVHHGLTARLTAAGIPTDANTGRDIPDVRTLSGPMLTAVHRAYGSGIGLVFLLVAPLVLVGVILVSLIHETPLRSKADFEHSANPATTPQFEDRPFIDPEPIVEPLARQHRSGLKLTNE
jgi:EmrB/QacA subfamily drug resistance transporter